jgi:hypothetical protein
MRSRLRLAPGLAAISTCREEIIIFPNLISKRCGSGRSPLTAVYGILMGLHDQTRQGHRRAKSTSGFGQRRTMADRGTPRRPRVVNRPSM